MPGCAILSPTQSPRLAPQQMRGPCAYLVVLRPHSSTPRIAMQGGAFGGATLRTAMRPRVRTSSIDPETVRRAALTRLPGVALVRVSRRDIPGHSLGAD